MSFLWLSLLLAVAGGLLTLALPSRPHGWLWALSLLYPTTLLIWFAFDPLVTVEGESTHSYIEAAQFVGAALFGIWAAIAAILYCIRRFFEELLRESRRY